jgi:hypothetical protein
MMRLSETGIYQFVRHDTDYYLKYYKFLNWDFIQNPYNTKEDLIIAIFEEIPKNKILNQIQNIQINQSVVPNKEKYPSLKSLDFKKINNNKDKLGILKDELEVCLKVIKE